jgi:hypothetical protein
LLELIHHILHTYFRPGALISIRIHCEQNGCSGLGKEEAVIKEKLWPRVIEGHAQFWGSV